MTARETTLGALTAADLGKRVVTEWGAGKLIEVAHTIYEHTEYMYRDEANGWVQTFASHPPDTPVTVYDERVPARSGDGPCNMTVPHPPHRWDREDRTHLRWECPGVQHDEEEA